MGETSINYVFGPYEDAVRQSLKTLQQNRIAERIWTADYTVWKAKPENIVNRLGWLDAPADTLKQLSYIQAVLDPILNEGYKNAVLLGMGGSSLAAEVFSKIFGSRESHPNLSILDTTDPATISRISQGFNLQETMFLVSSKSGTTLETVSLFHYFYNLALKKLGQRAGRNFIIITDPDSPLEELSYRLSLRHVFLNNPAIGGRYSALSFSGIVPAAIMGIDVKLLLQNAQATVQKEKPSPSKASSNSKSIMLGAALGALAQKGRNKLIFLLPDKWKYFGNWLEQLIAESTGKEGKSILPICTAQAAQPLKDGNDHLFVVYDDGSDMQSGDDTAFIADGHPAIKIRVNDAYETGSQMFLWEMATAVACHILRVNPFDQPNVEATKVLTSRMVSLYREKKELPQEKPSLITAECSIFGGPESSSAADALKNFLASAKKNDYICLQVYLSPTPEIDAQLRQLCLAIGHKYRIVVTSGYGPQYLHSTGQLHKGDAGRGLFIQLTADNPLDIEIPDRPGSTESSLTFGVLKHAQAMGDCEALLQLNRRVLRLHLSANVSANLNFVIAFLQ